MPMFTEILVGALLRATFTHGLRWRSPGEGFPVRPSPSGDRIEDDFRFADDGAWLAFEASATSPAHEVPQVRVRIAIPAGDVDAQEGMRRANDVNRAGLAAVYFDAPARNFVVQQSVVFTGYHDASPFDIDESLAFAQREATLNLLVAVFATSEACLRQRGPGQVLPRGRTR